MPDALEAQVILAARDSLLRISPGDGYITRPRVEVGPGLPMPPQLRQPMLRIHDAEGSRAVRIVHQPPMWEHSIRFAVECLAHGDDADDRVRAIGNLTADTRRRLLRQDRTLSGLVETVEEIEPDETDESIAKPDGWARLDFAARVTITEEED